MASYVTPVKPTATVGAYNAAKFGGKSTPFNDASYFRGAQETTRGQMIDPLITGYFFMKWIYIPAWVSDPFGGDIIVKQMLQKNVKSVQGLGSNTLNTSATTAGFTTNETHWATSIQKATGFSTNVQEYSGTPMSKLFTHWIHGIRDPRTNIATYPTWTTEGEYGAKYHTAEAIYIMMRPDAYNSTAGSAGKNIEHAVYLTNVMPTVVPRDWLNATGGTNDLVEFEQQYTADQHDSPAVINKAKDLVSVQSNDYIFTTEGGWTIPGA